MTSQQKADLLLLHWQSLWDLPPKERGERIDELIGRTPWMGNDNDYASQLAVNEALNRGDADVLR